MGGRAEGSIPGPSIELTVRQRPSDVVADVAAAVVVAAEVAAAASAPAAATDVDVVVEQQPVEKLEQSRFEYSLHLPRQPAALNDCSSSVVAGSEH